MKTETYVCQSCHADVVRPVARGQRPKWCPDCRAKSAWSRKSFTCEHCGREVQGFGTRYCSMTCTNRAKPPRPRKARPKKTREELEAAWRKQRGPLRAAYEDGDHAGVLAAVEAQVTKAESGCWHWSRKLKDGYPTVSIAGRSLQVHRIVLEAKHGAALGSQHAHHICANSVCVNPDHLQPVTHRENVAEMLARQTYIARIRELEAALADVAPGHPLLAVVAVA